MKIIKDARVRHYELTYLVPADLTSEEAKKAAEVVLGLIKKAKGKVLNSIDWGKKELSYMIKHAGERQYEAVYTHLELELDAANVQQLDLDLKILPELMRYLLVLSEDRQQNEAAQKPAKKPVQKQAAKTGIKTKLSPETKQEVKPETKREVKPEIKQEVKIKKKSAAKTSEKMAAKKVVKK